MREFGKTVLAVHDRQMRAITKSLLIGLALILLFVIFPGVSSARVSSKTTRFVAKHEGFRSTVYTDATGNPTIGYGHKLTRWSSARWGKRHAKKVLRRDLAYADRKVSKYTKVNLYRDQRTALTSFAFNCGVYALRSSTLLKKLNRGDYIGARKQFKRWVHDGNGKPIRGLVKRRKAEARMFKPYGPMRRH